LPLLTISLSFFTFEEHFSRIVSVTKRLEMHGLKLKSFTCEFFKSPVLCFGHVISETGISSDSEKIFKISNWPVPSNISELRTFLGASRIYRRFVEG